MFKSFKYLLLISTIILSGHCLAASELLYAKQMRQGLGLEKIWQEVKKNNARRLNELKIAILEPGLDVSVFDEDDNYIVDNGYLPPNTKVVEYYDKDFIEKYNLSPSTKIGFNDDGHGRRMAQIVYGLLKDDQALPQFYYLNTNGFTNFKRAVQYAIDEKIDIILYAQAWEFSGNLDGTGLVNDWVTKAADAGIIWINSVGNYSQAIYQGPLKATDQKVVFDKKDGQSEDLLHFVVTADDKDIKVVATWTDDLSDEGEHLTQDYDLYVYEWKNNKIGKLQGVSNLAQVLGEGDERKTSFLPREILTLSNLKNGHEYVVQIKEVATRQNAHDQIRVIVTADQGPYVKFKDANQGNTTMIPADNKNIIAVGNYAWDASAGQTIDGRYKPDIILPALRFPEGFTGEEKDFKFNLSTDRDAYTLAMFSDKFQVGGTSAEAAIYAAASALFISQKPALRHDLKQLLNQSLKVIGQSFSPALTKIDLNQMLLIQTELRYMVRMYLQNKSWPEMGNVSSAINQSKIRFANLYTKIDDVYGAQRDLLNNQLKQIAAEEAVVTRIDLAELPFNINKVDRFLAYYLTAGGPAVVLDTAAKTQTSPDQVFTAIIDQYFAQQMVVDLDRLLPASAVESKYAGFIAWLGAQYQGNYEAANRDFMQKLYDAYRAKFKRQPELPFNNTFDFLRFLDYTCPAAAADLNVLAN